MASGTETLKRTPLHDRHVAAGAKLVPFAGWEMPVQYAGIREEHVAVRTKVGVFDVSHMGEIETSGPDAEAFLQRILSNDVSKIAADGAQYSVLTKRRRRRARRPVHLPPRPRPLPDRHQREQPREGPRVVPEARRGLRRRRSTTSSHDYAMLAVQGPRRPRPRRTTRRRRAAQALPHDERPPSPERRARWSAAPATPARTASSCCWRRSMRRRCGTR